MQITTTRGYAVTARLRPNKPPDNAVLRTLLRAYCEMLIEMLGDPSGFVTGDARLDETRAAAEWFGLDFDDLLSKCGSPFEIERLAEIAYREAPR